MLQVSFQVPVRGRMRGLGLAKSYPACTPTGAARPTGETRTVASIARMRARNASISARPEAARFTRASISRRGGSRGGAGWRSTGWREEGPRDAGGSRPPWPRRFRPWTRSSLARSLRGDGDTSLLAERPSSRRLRASRDGPRTTRPPRQNARALRARSTFTYATWVSATRSLSKAARSEGRGALVLARGRDLGLEAAAGVHGRLCAHVGTPLVGQVWKDGARAAPGKARINSGTFGVSGRRPRGRDRAAARVREANALRSGAADRAQGRESRGTRAGASDGVIEGRGGRGAGAARRCLQRGPRPPSRREEGRLRSERFKASLRSGPPRPRGPGCGRMNTSSSEWNGPRGEDIEAPGEGPPPSVPSRRPPPRRRGGGRVTCTRSPKASTSLTSAWLAMISMAFRLGCEDLHHRTVGLGAHRVRRADVQDARAVHEGDALAALGFIEVGRGHEEVRPSRCSLARIFQKSRRATGSTLVVGSSRTRSCGVWIRVQASASFCFIPRKGDRRGGPRKGVMRGACREVLAARPGVSARHGCPRRTPRSSTVRSPYSEKRWGEVADALREFVGLLPRVEAARPHATAVRREQPENHPQCRGLSRAVRADESKHLAASHRETTSFAATRSP